MAKLIPLTRGQNAIVDDEDHEWLSQWKWGVLDHRGYAVRKNSKGKATWMHRLIINAPNGMQVDHINGDTLDNRRANLRLVTSQQNRMNQRLRSDNKTGYKGVFIKKKTGKYTAKIQCGNVIRNLGCFTSAHDAARAYNKAARDLFGEYAYLNNVEDNY